MMQLNGTAHRRGIKRLSALRSAVPAEFAYRRGDEAKLSGYGTKALTRAWKAERFSWYLTKLMHRFPEDGAFERRMQLAELDYIAQSQAMQTAIAENYVGLPL